MKSTLITVVGPTAIGKTALAISLAKYFGCDIISCDSRQFFQEMYIGTAVPSADELQQAPHHFIQHLSILEPYNVGDFEKDTLHLLEDLFKKNNIQIMVGGSGLYVDAVHKGLDDFPEVPPKIRESIRENYQQFGLPYLQNVLLEQDIEFYHHLEKNNPQTLKNPQRLMRFCEVCLGTGKPYSQFVNKKKSNRKFDMVTIGLEAPREILYERINERVDAMIKNGLLSEVENLLPFSDLNALQTVGYRELFAYFKGEIELETAVENIKQNSRRFAKRQLTWFKRDSKTIWFNYDDSHEKIIEALKTNLINAHS